MANLEADIVELFSRDYLIIVDYYSKYSEISLLSDKTTSTVINHLKSIYSWHDIPNELFTDDIPFTSKAVSDFARDWGFGITTSSPTSHNQMVRVKKLMRKAKDDGKDPYIALLEYPNTPLSGLEYSPAQILISRSLKSKFPAKGCKS